MEKWLLYGKNELHEHHNQLKYKVPSTSFISKFWGRHNKNIHIHPILVNWVLS